MFLKDSINWLCLVKECNQKNCYLRQFCRGLLKAYDEAPQVNKIDVFIDCIYKKITTILNLSIIFLKMDSEMI